MAAPIKWVQVHLINGQSVNVAFSKHFCDISKEYKTIIPKKNEAPSQTLSFNIEILREQTREDYWTVHAHQNRTAHEQHINIGTQQALHLDIWPVPTIGIVIGSCVCRQRWFLYQYSLLKNWFNTCPPYFQVESKTTRDFAAQCSLLTYTKV